MTLFEAMRNDKVPIRAMMILVTGLLLNTLFDYLFVIVFKWGVPGSAWATVIAQGICVFSALWYFYHTPNKLTLNLKLC